MDYFSKKLTVYLWRIHFDIWQNQYNIVKFKNKIKLKKKKKKETYCNGTNSCPLKIKATETEWFASSDLFSQSRSLFKVRVLPDFRWDLYHGIPHQKFSVDFSWQRKMITVQFCSQIHVIKFFHSLQVGESQKQMSHSYQGNCIPIPNKQAIKVYSSFLFPFFHLIFFLFKNQSYKKSNNKDMFKGEVKCLSSYTSLSSIICLRLTSVFSVFPFFNKSGIMLYTLLSLANFFSC